MKHGNKKIAGIVLAAGTSTRMGRSKQLLKIRGKTLAERVLSEALFSDLEKVVLVLGHDSERIRKGLEGISQDRKLVITVNPLYSDGMSTSLIAGLREVEDEYSRIMVLLGDMPFVRSVSYTHLRAHET